MKMRDKDKDIDVLNKTRLCLFRLWDAKLQTPEYLQTADMTVASLTKKLYRSKFL